MDCIYIYIYIFHYFLRKNYLLLDWTDFNGMVVVQNYLKRTGREKWAAKVFSLNPSWNLMSIRMNHLPLFIILFLGIFFGCPVSLAALFFFFSICCQFFLKNLHFYFYLTFEGLSTVLKIEKRMEKICQKTFLMIYLFYLHYGNKNDIIFCSSEKPPGTEMMQPCWRRWHPMVRATGIIYIYIY